MIYTINMALFIHAENQKILWSAISQSVLFQNLGNSRESWFRSAVEQFYQKIVNIPINPDLLQRVNKDFIQDMLKNLKNISINTSVPPIQPNAPLNNNNNNNTLHPPTPQQPQYYNPSVQNSYQPQQQPLPHQQPQYQYQQSQFYTPPSNASNPSNITYSMEPADTTLTRDYLAEQKQNQLSQQFNSRQEQYNSMLAKPLPKEVNFSEGKLDEPISNMGDLIKQHMMERDNEVRKYAPPPPQQQYQQRQQQQQQQQHPLPYQPQHPPLQYQQQQQQQQSSRPAILKIDDRVIPPPENIVEMGQGKNVHWPDEVQRTASDQDQRTSSDQVQRTASDQAQQTSTDIRIPQSDELPRDKHKIKLTQEVLSTLKDELREEIRKEFEKGFAELRGLLIQSSSSNNMVEGRVREGVGCDVVATTE